MGRCVRTAVGGERGVLSVLPLRLFSNLSNFEQLYDFIYTRARFPDFANRDSVGRCEFKNPLLEKTLQFRSSVTTRAIRSSDVAGSVPAVNTKGARLMKPVRINGRCVAGYIGCCYRGFVVSNPPSPTKKNGAVTRRTRVRRRLRHRPASLPRRQSTASQDRAAPWQRQLEERSCNRVTVRVRPTRGRR